MASIIIGSPHSRNDSLEEDVRRLLPDYRVLRISSPAQLTEKYFEEIKPEFVFFPHWSWRVPEQILDRYECVIFHMTDLPFGRGGSPLQNLILRGYRETRLTALRCTAEVDAGPIYMKRPLALEGTAEQILTRASSVMTEMIVKIVRERLVPVPQEGEPTVFKRRRPEDGNLAAVDELERIYDYIRMLDGEGYPRAFLETDALRFEFSDAKLEGESVEAKVRIVKKR